MPLKKLCYPFIALLCVLIPVSNLYGVPSSPRIHELVQPDEARINARQWEMSVITAGRQQKDILL